MIYPKEVKRLNVILARELGSVPAGCGDGGIFQWDWSEDLEWPAVRTGKTVEKTSPGGIVYFEPEMVSSRLSNRLKNQWVVTRWFPADRLDLWKERFPGAPYPARGYRIHTDYYNKPFRIPGHDDTMFLISQLREQLSGMGFAGRLTQMEDERAKAERSRDNRLYDAVQNEFTAGLNPYPGKRGHFVSWNAGFGDSPTVKKFKETHG